MRQHMEYATATIHAFPKKFTFHLIRCLYNTSYDHMWGQEKLQMNGWTICDGAT